MEDLFFLEIVRKGFLLVLATSTPPLLAAMTIGLVVGAFMAATSIQEITLTFFPKLVAVLLVVFFSAQLLMGLLTEFTTGVYAAIPEMVR